MPIGELLAILGFPPILGVYYGSAVLLLGTYTLGSAEEALRESERAAVYSSAMATGPATLGFLAALAFGS
jgi:heme/copper-type cytochrome/quinol oxidase subunit 3